MEPIVCKWARDSPWRPSSWYKPRHPPRPWRSSGCPRNIQLLCPCRISRPCRSYHPDWKKRAELMINYSCIDPKTRHGRWLKIETCPSSLERFELWKKCDFRTYKILQITPFLRPMSIIIAILQVIFYINYKVEFFWKPSAFAPQGRRRLTFKEENVDACWRWRYQEVKCSLASHEAYVTTRHEYVSVNNPVHVPCPVIDFPLQIKWTGEARGTGSIIDKPGNIAAYETCRRHRFSHRRRPVDEGLSGVWREFLTS